MCLGRLLLHLSHHSRLNAKVVRVVVLRITLPAIVKHSTSPVQILSPRIDRAPSPGPRLVRQAAHPLRKAAKMNSMSRMISQPLLHHAGVGASPRPHARIRNTTRKWSERELPTGRPHI